MDEMRIVFLVQGSSESLYNVTFIKDGDSLAATCDYQAGENGVHCKHRLNILDGDVTNIFSDNVDDVSTVNSWLQGTSLEKALSDLKEAAAHEAKAKREHAAAKKRVAQAMNGQI